MSQTNHDKLKALKSQLANLTAELEAVKKVRATARIEGRPFERYDHVVELSNEIEVITEALPLVQQLVDADDARTGALREALRLEEGLKHFEEGNAAYLGHVATIEGATAEMFKAFAAIHAMLPTLSTHILTLTGQTHDPLFIRQNSDARLFNRMAAVLGDEFEPLRPYSAPASDVLAWPISWVDHESRTVDAMVRGFLSKLRAQIAELRSSAEE